MNCLNLLRIGMNSKASINDLIKVKGIGLQKAITLKAAFELGKGWGESQK